MEKIDYKKKQDEANDQLNFIIGCLCNYNFYSFKRFLIYIFHFLNYIDLKEKSSEKYTDKELIKIFESIYKKKINKKDLYELTQCNKNTFNKRFKEYFELKNFVGKRKFTLLETYDILNEWQGEGDWAMMNSIKKEKLVEIISPGSYKKLANEFSLVIGDKYYKNNDKFSPKEVKKLLSHIDLSDSKEAEKLLKYDEFESISLWFFVKSIFIYIYNENKHYTQQCV